MPASIQVYAREYDLVRDFCAILISQTSPWGEVRLAEEFFYQRGRTDIIISAHRSVIIAFEVKLHRWRDGISQAYRNTCFAHFSYLVLPAKAASLAEGAVSEFSRYSVGLCVASAESVKILIPSPRHEPIQPWITDAAFSVMEL